MTVRAELKTHLASLALDRPEVDAAIDMIFDIVIARLCRRFPDVARASFDLMLADARRDSEELLDSLITGSVDLDTTVEIIATRFLGED